MFQVLLDLDHQMFQLVNSHHAPFFDTLFALVTNLGNGWVVTPILLVIAFFCVPRKRLVPYIIIATIGMTASGMANLNVKQSCHRQRPLAYYMTSQTTATETPPPKYTVHIVGEPLTSRSFPSGHSNTAFSAAALVALSFGGWYWLAFVPAMLVGYSRLYMGVHFPLDVVAGGLLGIVIVAITVIVYKSVVRMLEKK
jgi:undecaprenyl-diphosphatase